VSLDEGTLSNVVGAASVGIALPPFVTHTSNANALLGGEF
jgi:hypothetical protein